MNTIYLRPEHIELLKTAKTVGHGICWGETEYENFIHQMPEIIEIVLNTAKLDPGYYQVKGGNLEKIRGCGYSGFELVRAIEKSV